ncbi:MAG TPA: putative lipid II flippase FtsW [Candidatus Binataceae bacterium]|nr:putative lipid II flippase FtsW [Candidatus Binataceae bacterium]
MDVGLKSWLRRFDNLTQERPDPWLWMPAAALIVLGLLMVLNTTYFLGLERHGGPFYFFKRQLLNLAMGATVMTALGELSLRGLKRLALPLMVVAVALLLAVWVPGLGVARGGARRWLHLGAFLIEPSELLKLATVFFLADYLAPRQVQLASSPRALIAPFAIVGVLALLLLKQPDFGGAVMLVLLLFTMLFVAEARPRHLAIAGAGALCAIAFQAAHKAYRMRRLTAFIDPWRTARGAGFQLTQSLIAFGAGGSWGVGLGASRQKMFYLPQAHTDFVFAVVGEEFGCAGVFVVLALFLIIMVRGLRLARLESDPFGSLLAVGLTSLISLQAFVNMAVVTGLVPTKGLPLPFLSYGGTSMVVSMAALGILLALGRRPGVE